MCSEAGAWLVDMAIEKVMRSLHAQQSRGQDFAGVTVMNHSGKMTTVSGRGLVLDVITPQVVSGLKGRACAIGHTRYPTSEDSGNAQPIELRWGKHKFAIAHVGNFYNVQKIRTKKLPDENFKTGMDTEVFARLLRLYSPEMPKDPKKIAEVIIKVFSKMRGTGSILILTPHGLFACRDEYGNRPMVFGSHRKGGHVVASEEGGLFALGIYESTEVKPGTIVCFSDRGVQEFKFTQKRENLQLCPFELAYFAQPSGRVFGIPVLEVREALGEETAIECPVQDADLILPIPDSGIPAAKGFLKGNPSGIYEDQAIRRSHYARRTFIEGTQRARDIGVKFKNHITPGLLRGKRVVLVDDSLIRGTTSRRLVKLVRSAGAAEVHFRSAYPWWLQKCIYGVSTKENDELALNIHGSVDKLRQFIDADSLGALSVEGLDRVLSRYRNPDDFCHACKGGDYII